MKCCCTFLYGPRWVEAIHNDRASIVYFVKYPLLLLWFLFPSFRADTFIGLGLGCFRFSFLFISFSFLLLLLVLLLWFCCCFIILFTNIIAGITLYRLTYIYTFVRYMYTNMHKIFCLLLCFFFGKTNDTSVKNRSTASHHKNKTIPTSIPLYVYKYIFSCLSFSFLCCCCWFFFFFLFIVVSTFGFV